MVDQELINAIKAINKPIQDKLEEIDIKLSKLQVQVDTLELDIKTSERNIRREVHQLQDGMDTLVEVLERNGMLPIAK